MDLADAWELARMAVMTGRAVPPARWVDEAVDAATAANWDAFGPG